MQQPSHTPPPCHAYTYCSTHRAGGESSDAQLAGLLAGGLQVRIGGARTLELKL